MDPAPEDLGRAVPAALALAALWAGLGALEAFLPRPGWLLPGLLAGALVLALAAARRADLARTLAGLPLALAQFAALAAGVAALAAGARAGAAWARAPLERPALLAPLLLLALTALAVALRRRPYRPSRYGFLAVHLAPALLVAGLFLDALAGGTRVLGLPAGGEAALPDGSRLVLRDLKVAEEGRALVLRAFPRATAEAEFGAPSVLAGRPGARLDLAAPACTVEVLEALPDALLERRFREEPSAPEDPALFLMLGIGVDPAPRGYLFSRRPGLDRQEAPGGAFSVEFREAWEDRMAGEYGPGRGLLRVRQGGREEVREVRPGLVWEAPGLRLKVATLYPDFAVRPGPGGGPVPFSRSPEPREPWLALDLEPAGGAPRRLLLSAREPARTEALNAPWLPKGLQLAFQWREAGPARPRLVATRTDRRLRLVAGGRVVRTEPLEPGRPFVVAPGLSLLPVALLVRPLEDPRFVARTGPPVQDPVRALRVRVTGPAGSAERWLEARGAGGEPALVLEGRLGLVYRLEDPRPGDLRAEVSVRSTDGRELARGWAGGAASLGFGGLRLRPAGLLADGTGVALEVRRRPGRVLAWAAWGTLLAGLVWMFWIKPPLKRRERGGAP